MSDWKRFAVWIGVIAWCFFSLAFDVRAQKCTDDDTIQLAQGQITIHKKLGTSNRVTGAVGGFGGPVSVEAGVADGPNQWYYVVDDAPTDSSSWSTSYYMGGPITCTVGGSITKLRVMANSNSTTSGAIVRAVLWKLVGATWTFHECLEIAIPKTGAGWYEGTLLTPLTVANGEVVRVMAGSSDSAVLYFYEGTSGGYFFTRLYDDACSTTAPTWADDYRVALAVYVD